MPFIPFFFLISVSLVEKHENQTPQRIDQFDLQNTYKPHDFSFFNEIMTIVMNLKTSTNYQVNIIWKALSVNNLNFSLIHRTFIYHWTSVQLTPWKKNSVRKSDVISFISCSAKSSHFKSLNPLTPDVH